MGSKLLDCISHQHFRGTCVCVHICGILIMIEHTSLTLSSHILTSPIHYPRLLHGLLQHTQGIVKRSFTLIRDLLSGSSDDNCTSLSQSYTREPKQLHVCVFACVYRIA